MVAQDAQYKLLRFGLPSSCYVDPRLQQLAAQVLGAGDVALIVSSAGRLPELLEVADLARARGAKVLANTASQSPLVKKADVAVGLTMRRGVAQPEPLEQLDETALLPLPRAARATTPGVSLASLASLTSHSR